MLPARAIPGEIYLEHLSMGALTPIGGERLSMDSSQQEAHKEVMHRQ